MNKNKRENKKKYTQTTPHRNKGLTVESETLIQMLRIRLWQIIARNNAEDLVDPMLNPLKNPAPYVQNAKAKKQTPTPAKAQPKADTAEITPTLDEVLPLPKKAEAKPAPKKEEPKSEAKTKKTSAKDLIAEESDELPGQMTIDEAIEQADGASPQQSAPASENKPIKTTEPEKDKSTESSQKSEETSEESDRPTLRERYIAWKIERTERKDYFNQLEVQIQNKNSACFEILDYLDELQNED